MRWLPVPARVVAGAGALAALLLACRIPAPLVSGMFARRPPELVPTARDCERCHQEVYREWRGSLHARAWESSSFQAASARGRAGACTGCHAPAPVTAGRPPELRAQHLHEGVTCTTCHLSTDPDDPPLTMRGPESRTSPVQVHPVVERDALYRSSELCGTCHAGAFAEWRAAAAPPDGSEKETCQGCHMPAVVRKMESVHDEHAYSALFVALGEERELRRHDFAVPADVGGDISLVVREDAVGRALAVRIENHLPHAVPTGRYGRRELRIAASWPGGGGEAARLTRALGDAIEAGGSRDLRMELPAGVDPGQARVRLERWDHAEARWRTLLADPRTDGLHLPDRLPSESGQGAGRSSPR